MTLRRPWRWVLVALALAAMVLGVWAFWLEPASLTVAEERLLLPARLGGSLGLAVLTDLHVGSPFTASIGSGRSWTAPTPCGPTSSACSGTS